MKKLLIILGLVSFPLLASAAIPDQPACDNGYIYEGTYDAVLGDWVGECVARPASTSFVHFLPKVAWVNVYGRTIAWLNTHFMETRVVIGKTSVPFPIGTYGTPYFGYDNDVLVNGYQGTDYGYEMTVLGMEGAWTAGSVTLPSHLSGKYYGRIISKMFGIQEIVSPEFQIEL